MAIWMRETVRDWRLPSFSPTPLKILLINNGVTMATSNQKLDSTNSTVAKKLSRVTADCCNEYFLSVGRLLSSKRQKSGRTIQEMEQITGLCPFQIEALERGDFKKFRAPTYTKGYIKVYSRALGLKEDELVDSYLHGVDVEKENLEKQSEIAPQTDKQTIHKSILSKVIAPFNSPAVAFCLLGVVISLVLPVQSLVMSDQQPDEVSIIPPNSGAVPPESLEINVSQESWVEVLDAKGNILLAELEPAGKKEVLQGEPPFQIKIDGGEVSAKYLGQSIHLDGISGDNTAKLALVH